MSYNVAAAFDDYHDKYFWVIRGVRFLEEGKRYNDREPRLLWDIGWFISNKIGRADEKKLFRRLFKEDDDFNGSPPPDLRDNWLVGEEWFRDAEKLVETTGERLQGGRSPDLLLRRPDVPDELFQAPWKTTACSARRPGWPGRGPAKSGASTATATSFPTKTTRWCSTTRKGTRRSRENCSPSSTRLSPGLREKMRKEKLDRLEPAERKALDTPPIAKKRICPRDRLGQPTAHAGQGQPAETTPPART